MEMCCGAVSGYKKVSIKKMGYKILMKDYKDVFSLWQMV